MSTAYDPGYWGGRKVLITGGAGFLGSTLAHHLVPLGAKVTIVDCMMPGFGGNLFNLTSLENEIRINFCDIRDRHAMEFLVKDQEVIFHAAQLNDHVAALADPFPDLNVNILGTTNVMEAIRVAGHRPRVLYLGTRSEYGEVGNLPVREDAPTNPKGIYELSTLTAQKIMLFYHRQHQIPTTVFRITNVYGPRGQMKHNRTGVANWFVRQLIDGNPIPLMGTGKILRDFLYVDDVIKALITAAQATETKGELYNVGSDQPTSFLQLAESMVAANNGEGSIKYIPLSPERAASEPGDFYSDISKIRKAIGWQPSTPINEGLAKTLVFYRQHREKYWP